MKVLRLGRTAYGSKWHLLREDGRPACGYTSYNWKPGNLSVIEVNGSPLPDLCANYRKILTSRKISR